MNHKEKALREKPGLISSEEIFRFIGKRCELAVPAAMRIFSPLAARSKRNADCRTGLHAGSQKKHGGGHSRPRRDHHLFSTFSAKPGKSSTRITRPSSRIAVPVKRPNT